MSITNSFHDFVTREWNVFSEDLGLFSALEEPLQTHKQDSGVEPNQSNVSPHVENSEVLQEFSVQVMTQKSPSNTPSEAQEKRTCIANQKSIGHKGKRDEKTKKAEKQMRTQDESPANQVYTGLDLTGEKSDSEQGDLLVNTNPKSLDTKKESVEASLDPSLKYQEKAEQVLSKLKELWNKREYRTIEDQAEEVLKSGYYALSTRWEIRLISFQALNELKESQKVLNSFKSSPNQKSFEELNHPGLSKQVTAEVEKAKCRIGINKMDQSDEPFSSSAPFVIKRKMKRKRIIED